MAGEEDRPWLTDHVMGGNGHDGPGRWDERTPIGSVSPERAWEEGIDLADHVCEWFSHDSDSPDPDRVRLFAEFDDVDEPYQVLFLVVEDNQPTVTTIYTADMIHDPAKRGYLKGRAIQHFHDSNPDDGGGD
jgi:hypothetical protein